MRKLTFLLLLLASIYCNAQQGAKNQNFRIAVNAGFSQLLAKTSNSVPSQSKNYVSALKSGANYGIDASYFISKEWGFGMKFNQFKSSNSGTYYDSNLGSTVSMADHITHTFIGPSAATRYVSPNNKHGLVFTLALGYLGYLNDGALNGTSFKIKGGTFGSALDAGYDYHVNKRFALGVQASLVGGVLKSYTVTYANTTQKIELDEKSKESLSRIDLSFGARFNF